MHSGVGRLEHLSLGASRFRPLDGFGLAIIAPTNGKLTCAQHAEGTLFDHSVKKQGAPSHGAVMRNSELRAVCHSQGGSRYLLRVACAHHS